MSVEQVNNTMQIIAFLYFAFRLFTPIFVYLQLFLFFFNNIKDEYDLSIGLVDFDFFNSFMLFLHNIINDFTFRKVIKLNGKIPDRKTLINTNLNDGCMLQLWNENIPR